MGCDIHLVLETAQDLGRNEYGPWAAYLAAQARTTAIEAAQRLKRGY